MAVRPRQSPALADRIELQKSAPDRHNVGPQHQQLSTEKPATRQRKTNRGSAMESRGEQQKGRKKKKPRNHTIKKTTSTQAISNKKRNRPADETQRYR